MVTACAEYKGSEKSPAELIGYPKDEKKTKTKKNKSIFIIEAYIIMSGVCKNQTLKELKDPNSCISLCIKWPYDGA